MTPHTRHYMPWEKKGPDDRTLVFDTFVAVSRHDRVWVGWPDADLNSEDRDALAAVVANLSSLGRAEGWVQAELAEDISDWNCGPVETGDGTPVFCPDPESACGSEHYRSCRGERPVAFLRLTFDRPVSGPISLGYGNHFGL